MRLALKESAPRRRRYPCVIGTDDLRHTRNELKLPIGSRLGTGRKNPSARPVFTFRLRNPSVDNLLKKIDETVVEFRRDGERINLESLARTKEVAELLATRFRSVDVAVDLDGYFALEICHEETNAAIWVRPESIVYSVIDETTGGRLRGSMPYGDKQAILKLVRLIPGGKNWRESSEREIPSAGSRSIRVG